MSFVARIETRAYSRATEVLDRVVTAILNLYPEKYRNTVEFDISRTVGHSGYEIQVVESELKDKVGCEDTLDYIFGRFDERDRERLFNSLSRRLDQHCFFFIRIDKQAAFMDEIVLAREADVISVHVHIQQYPRCKQGEVIAMLESRLRAAGGDS